MTEESKTIIEIHGVKMEVDLRHARRIDELCVGDRVKVLIKTYSGHAAHPGVVIGFEPFRELPTIIVAYMDVSFSSADLKFLYFNKATKETELIKAIDDDQLEFSKSDVVNRLDKEIQKHAAEILELENKKKYFLSKFKTYWAPVVTEGAETDE